MSEGFDSEQNGRGVIEEQYNGLSHLGGPQTPIRIGVLAEVHENGPLSKRELRDVFVEGDGRWGFEVSKPTLYRQFDEDTGTGSEDSLVERGWIMDTSESEGAESKYAVTPKGRLVYNEASSLLDTFGRVDDLRSELEPFLEVVTKSDFEMDQEVLCGLKGAEVYAATPTDMHGALTEAIQYIFGSDFAHGMSWVSSELFVDQYYEYVVEQDSVAELVLTQDVLERLVERYTERWGEILETGRIELFEYDVYPFGLTVVEDGVAWGYFEPETGAHEYELITESDAVQSWASEVFEEFKQRGRKVTDKQLERTRE
jgi:hypothetical protein